MSKIMGMAFSGRPGGWKFLRHSHIVGLPTNDTFASFAGSGPPGIGGFV
jgi:hypothetical protein